MSESKYFLFPNVNISESQAKKVSSLSGPFFLCQPWYMEPPPHTGPIPIKILTPPVSLKPTEDFHRIMGGYLAWMEENRDRGYALYLAANEHGNEDDFTISTIRQMIRNEYPIAGSTPIDSALLCHLVLHLYSLSEDSSLRVQQHLNQIKITPSPLAGVLENEDETQNIFSDIESTVSEAYPTKKRGRQVLDSWFSLFSSHLTSAVTLVTFDDWVKDTLLSLADEEMRQETQQESQISYTYISFPQKWLRTHQRNDPLLNKIAGKKLITLGC